MRRISHLPAAGLAVLVLAASCGAKPPASTGNRVANPSFEAGREPWFAPETPVWAGFGLTDETARAGRHSAVLKLTSDGYGRDTRIAGAVQDLAVETLPRRLRGWYRVESWERGAEKQYVQVVVSVKGARNLPDPDAPKQVAFVLAGITERPFSMVNRGFEFAGPRRPRQGAWIRFAFDIHESYRKTWGAVPAGFERVRLFLEVRFDERDPAGPHPARAVVLYDDIYVGDEPG